jgi:hypothetical protein
MSLPTAACPCGSGDFAVRARHWLYVDRDLFD